MYSFVEMEEIFKDQTLLALDTNILDPNLALSKGLQHLEERQILIPDISTYHIIWFPKENHTYDSRTCIVFHIPTPNGLAATHEWDRINYIEDLAVSQGHFVETETTAINLAIP